MWRNHRSVFQDHLKYIHNDIVKPCCVGIIRYAERFQEMYDLENIYLNFRWRARFLRQLVENYTTNNSLYMRFELLLRTNSPHPYRMSWRIINRTIVPWLIHIGLNSCPQPRSKVIVKRAATQTKRNKTSRSASYSDSNESIRVLRKKRDRTGVFLNRKKQGEKMPKHHDSQSYFVPYKNAGIPGSPHPCRMSWRIINRTIVPWLIHIGLNSCPQPRSKVIVKGQQPKPD